MNKSAMQKYVPGCDFKRCNDINKYDKIEKIGQGTFGEVFKARNRENPSQFVAVKKLVMYTRADGFSIAQPREINILKKLKHDNIVNLIEVCRMIASHAKSNLTPFFLIFEFCEHDLAGLLSNANVEFDLGEIKNVMRQLLEGLKYIHENKILHRDLKAANVLITRQGVLKLADFGLAIVYSNDESDCMTNRVVTLWYRSPELLLGDRNYGPAIDLWGAGCIMAQMWKREAIFQGNNEQEQLTLISDICGTINPEVWPGVAKLDLYNKMELPKHWKRRVIEFIKPYMKDDHGCDLLDKLLMLDPSQRIDAVSALNHDFFRTEPMPSDLAKTMARHRNSMLDYLVSQRQDAE